MSDAPAIPTLPFGEPGLIRVRRTDVGSRLLADRHYSRQTPGAREFLGNGRTLLLRNEAGTAVFGWLYPTDGMHAAGPGAHCAIFRNESGRRSSEIILEAETHAIAEWPDLPRFMTYVNPGRIRSTNPGYCFKVAGYRFRSVSTRGLHLLVKERPSE